MLSIFDCVRKDENSITKNTNFTFKNTILKPNNDGLKNEKYIK